MPSEFEEVWPDDYILLLRSKGWSEQAIRYEIECMQERRKEERKLWWERERQRLRDQND